jgi:hypothetical protein
MGGGLGLSFGVLEHLVLFLFSIFFFEKEDETSAPR